MLRFTWNQGEHIPQADRVHTIGSWHPSPDKKCLCNFDLRTGWPTSHHMMPKPLSLKVGADMNLLLFGSNKDWITLWMLLADMNLLASKKGGHGLYKESLIDHHLCGSRLETALAGPGPGTHPPSWTPPKHLLAAPWLLLAQARSHCGKEGLPLKEGACEAHPTLLTSRLQSSRIFETL